MQATAAAASLSTSPDIWQQEASASQWKVIEPVIELAITQANAQGAYVYYFDQQNAHASLSAFVGPAPFKKDASGAAVAFHKERRTPIVIHQDAAADWRFAILPEFKSGRFDGVLSVPLIAPTGVVGMANFCRIEGTSFKARELSFLVGLSAPLAALLTTSTVREELERTAQQLADRKLLDRAKGLLQESLGWTEE
jgi:GAF domain-containing protein